jgi:hypothetical protein
MTSNERRFYVRGVLAACTQFKASPSVVTLVCRELGLTSEDLSKLITEEREATQIERETAKVARAVRKVASADLGSGAVRLTR